MTADTLSKKGRFLRTFNIENAKSFRKTKAKLINKVKTAHMDSAGRLTKSLCRNSYGYKTRETLWLVKTKLTMMIRIRTGHCAELRIRT